jgi:hypothetical protein
LGVHAGWDLMCLSEDILAEILIIDIVQEATIWFTTGLIVLHFSVLGL